MQSNCGIELPAGFALSHEPKFIEDAKNKHEEADKLKKQVDHTKVTFEERHGFPCMRTVGPSILVEIHTSKLSEKITIVDSYKEKQKWISNVGRVCYIGNACYKDERFKDWDVLPKIGDWVTFKPGAGASFKYRGINVSIIYDDAVIGITEDPEYVTRD